MSASEFLERSWEMILTGEVVSDAVQKTDETFFGSITVTETLGGGDTITAGVETINSIANGDVTGAGKGIASVAASKAKVLKPIAEAVKNALKSDKKVKHTLTIDGEDALQKMRQERSNLKTGTLDNKQKDRELYNAIKRTEKELKGREDKSSKFKVVQKVLEAIKGIGEWF